jgi:hypothetical protein
VTPKTLMCEFHRYSVVQFSDACFFPLKVHISRICHFQFIIVINDDIGYWSAQSLTQLTNRFCQISFRILSSIRQRLLLRIRAGGQDREAEEKKKIDNLVTSSLIRIKIIEVGVRKNFAVVQITLW